MELTARPSVGSMTRKMQSKHSLTIARLRRLAPLALAIVALLVVRMYVRQVIELVRLQSWQSQLVSENAEIERDVAQLSFELERRDTEAWVVEQLHAMGLLAPDEVRVRAIPVTAAVPVTPTPPSSSRVSEVIESTALFRNEIWNAWKALLLGDPSPGSEGLAPPSGP
jgi:hypothetical protein